MGNKRTERKMTFAEFQQVVGVCSPDEVTRLQARYQRYYCEHRVLFVDFLTGKYTDEKAFFDEALRLRKKATAEGKTWAERVTRADGTKSGDGTREQTDRGFRHANERKFLKLAVRIRYLRLTGGKDQRRGRDYKLWELPGEAPYQAPGAAMQRLEPIFARWGVSYEGIRKRHCPFQDECEPKSSTVPT